MEYKKIDENTIEKIKTVILKKKDVMERIIECQGIIANYQKEIEILNMEITELQSLPFDK